MAGPVRSRRWRRRGAVALAATTVAIAASVAVASHTDNMFMTANFDSACLDGGHFCRTDNATLTVYRGTALSSTGRANIAWTLNNSWNTTDLNVSYHSSPVTSGGAETDIVYQHNPGRVPANLDGFAWCNDAVGPQECDQHYVAFRSVSPSRGLACHETGHAVGLTHGQNASPKVSQTNAALACMTTPVQSQYVGSHNVGQVNSHY